MIRVELRAAADGALRSCTAAGHAGFAPAGTDIVCAAVSMLLRTVASALRKTPGVTVAVTAPEKGDFAFGVEKAATPEGGMAVRFAYTVLVTGLRDLEGEYPGHICVNEIVEE
jgi:uncharacterized protein YsxB (DUF464 family)